MTASLQKWLRPSLLVAALTLLVHLIFNGGYGIFRDELYFIVCGRHPAWGYVDQPPLVPLIAAWSYALSGDWLTGFRLVPALAFAVTAGLTAEFARYLGGGRFSQWLAGLCVLGAPHFLAIGMLFTTDTFQPMTWLAAAWLLVHIERTKGERWWLAFGAVVGFSLLSKYMVAFYVMALGIGLLATPLRRSLLKPWIYAGAALGLLIALPNILWQQAHGWPFIELGKAGASGKNIALSPLAFFAQQFLLIGPLAAPVWLAGLWASLRSPAFKVYRAFPIALALLFAFFVATHGKAYYLTSIYPVIIPIGAIAIERWLPWLWARGFALANLVVASAVIAPLAIPVMDEESYIRYSASLGFTPATTAAEHHKQARLPQHFADMHGWPEMAKRIAAVYNALPPAERAKARFFANNYGDAGAIDVYGSKLGMPPAISGHNSYFLWGPQGADGSVIIEIGGTRESHLDDFRSVEFAGWIENAYAMPYETHQPIWIERGLKKPMSEVWPTVKHYE